MRDDRVRGALAFPGLMLATLVVAACATAPGPSTGPKPDIPDTATLAVVSRGVDEDLEARFNRDSTLEGANTGAAAGEATGWAAAAFCGPLFFLCALGTVPAGMLVGAAAGATAGAVKDAKKKPEREELERLEALLEAISERRTLHEEVRTAVAARVPAHRRSDGKGADALIEIKLGDIRFQQVANGNYQWLLRVNLAAQWNRNEGRVRGGTNHYTAYSAAVPLDQWIDQDGSAIEAALDEVITEVSDDIERDLFQ